VCARGPQLGAAAAAAGTAISLPGGLDTQRNREQFQEARMPINSEGEQLYATRGTSRRNVIHAAKTLSCDTRCEGAEDEPAAAS
jgi:hypothetical protein